MCANLHAGQREIQFQIFLLNADQLENAVWITIWIIWRKPSIYWSLVLTVLVYIQRLCCVFGCTCSSPSRVCAGRPLSPGEPLPQHHLQLQLAAAVIPAGLHLWSLPHSGLVPVSDFWQASQHAHPVCGGKHVAKTYTGETYREIWWHFVVYFSHKVYKLSEIFIYLSMLWITGFKG